MAELATRYNSAIGSFVRQRGSNKIGSISGYPNYPDQSRVAVTFIDSYSTLELGDLVVISIEEILGMASKFLEPSLRDGTL